jgi:hypothetical protein
MYIVKYEQFIPFSPAFQIAFCGFIVLSCVCVCVRAHCALILFTPQYPLHPPPLSHLYFLVLWTWLLYVCHLYIGNHTIFLFCDQFIPINNVFNVHVCYNMGQHLLLFNIKWYSNLFIYNILGIFLQFGLCICYIQYILVITLPNNVINLLAIVSNNFCGVEFTYPEVRFWVIW